MLAKAFLARPAVALLDKPTASLDPDIATEICAFGVERHDEEGVSIVFTSHNMDEVAQFRRPGDLPGPLPDRLQRSARGLAASEAATRLRLCVTQGMPQLLEHVDSAGLSRSLDDGVVDVEIDEGRLSDLRRSSPSPVCAMVRSPLGTPTLEDYFLKLAAARGHAAGRCRFDWGGPAMRSSLGRIVAMILRHLYIGSNC